MKRTTPQAYVILGLLMEGAKHGYEIYQSELFSIWFIPMSQLYILLKRLEGEGMIRSSLMVQENRPGKRVYTVTEKGRAAFLEWVCRPSEKIRNIRMEFLAKLYMIHKLHLDMGEALVNAQINVCIERKNILSEMKSENGESFESLVKLYRNTMIDATIRWLENCLTFLRELEHS